MIKTEKNREYDKNREKNKKYDRDRRNDKFGNINKLRKNKYMNKRKVKIKIYLTQKNDNENENGFDNNDNYQKELNYYDLDYEKN